MRYQLRCRVRLYEKLQIAGDDDATNLEIALLARKANPDVRDGAAGQRRVARSGGRR
jgi:hypothetical protein